MSTTEYPLARRWPIAGTGRSHTVAFAGTIWTVANALDRNATFEQQARESLAVLDGHLIDAGSSRGHILSLQVILADIRQRDSFDQIWRKWIGDNAAHWPQRACFEARLAPGLRVELIVIASPIPRQRETPHDDPFDTKST